MYIFIHRHIYIYVNISVLVLAFTSTFPPLSFNQKSYTRRFELMCIWEAPFHGASEQSSTTQAYYGWYVSAGCENL